MSDEETVESVRATLHTPAVAVTCAVCRREKIPRGRSQAAAAWGGHCTDACSAYESPPRPGFLWPGETCAGFGYARSVRDEDVATVLAALDDARAEVTHLRAEIHRLATATSAAIHAPPRAVRGSE